MSVNTGATCKKAPSRDLGHAERGREEIVNRRPRGGRRVTTGVPGGPLEELLEAEVLHAREAVVRDLRKRRKYSFLKINKFC